MAQNGEGFPIASPHHTEYIPGTEDWEKKLTEWKDIGQQYRKDPNFSLLGLFGQNKPLPSEEITFFQNHGIKFEKQLGRGAEGSVWLVSKTTINQGQLEKMRMACKILNLKTHGGEPSFLDRFRQRGPQRNVSQAVERLVSEAEIQRKLVHKNIVKCEYVFKIHDPKTGFPYCRLLMFIELCDGNLLNLIDKSPEQKFTENKAKEMLRQVSEGLQYMHDKHICHFDIKPENILYVIESGAQLIYKLSDLGLSMSFDNAEQTVEGPPTGTFYYMAPEIMSDECYMPKPADIYSLGCVLAQTVVRQSRWFLFLEYMEKCPRHKVPALSSVYGVSPLCGDLIYRMTNMDPDQRPTIREVLNHSWFNSKKPSRSNN